MERDSPKLQNKKEIPVNIFKGAKLVAECSSIQEAVRFFKKETKARNFNWSAINKGIWFDESYSIKGATYFFTTDEEAVKNKMKE